MTTPPLQRFSCNHLFLATTCRLPDEIVDRLRNETKPDRTTERTLEWKWDAQPANGEFVYSKALIQFKGSRIERRGDIAFHYDLTGKAPLKWYWACPTHGPFIAPSSLAGVKCPMPGCNYVWRKDVRPLSRVEKIISLLRDLQEEPEFTCGAIFQYDESIARKLFPIRGELSEISDGLYDEIRGLTLAKTADGRETYRVVIESPDLTDVSLEVIFISRRRFTEKLPSEILEQAHLIISKFVAP